MVLTYVEKKPAPLPKNCSTAIPCARSTVQRRNILRRGNLVTTSAAIVPLMEPRHWLATVQPSVSDFTVWWESVSAKWRPNSCLHIHSVVSDHAKDCAQIVRSEYISRHLGEQAHHGCNEHTAAHTGSLEHVEQDCFANSSSSLILVLI